MDINQNKILKIQDKIKLKYSVKKGFANESHEPEFAIDLKFNS